MTGPFFGVTSTAIATDRLLLGLLLVSAAVLALVFGLMFFYLVRYRYNSPIDRGQLEEHSFKFEISWTVATLAVFFALFLWSSVIYIDETKIPDNAQKIYIVAKQWMWKAQHAGGQREINALHVPVDKPIELVMTSEDVIHDFFVPAFRLKRDLLPGQYETLWFNARKIGDYQLLCAQFCGTEHSAMTGTVYVMSAPDYAAWLARNGTSDTLVAQGHALFIRNGCDGCHGGRGTVRAPPLVGLFGSPVPLSDGTTVIADDAYIRDSILQPDKQVVASYAPVMPSFKGVISEDDLIKLVAYVESLAPQSHPGGNQP